MPSQDHTLLVRQYINDVWNAGQSALPFFAPHYKRYVAATAAALTAEEQSQRITAFRTAFPDLQLTIDDLVAEGDRVMFRATLRGTHQGVFRGIPSTGKQVTVTVLDVVRVDQGLFTEHWGGPDLLDLLQQLGAAVTVRPTNSDQPDGLKLTD